MVNLEIIRNKIIKKDMKCMEILSNLLDIFYLGDFNDKNINKIEDCLIKLDDNYENNNLCKSQKDIYIARNMANIVNNIDYIWPTYSRYYN